MPVNKIKNSAPLFIFFSLAFVGTICHEMWRDELQAWSLGLQSHSLKDLFSYSKYEGHPWLWFLCIYAITFFTQDPFYMQLVHLLIATSSVYLFFRYAPFSFTDKLLLIFGYFFFYEYTVISRNYALGTFFLFLFCHVYSRTPFAFVTISVILFMLMQTNAFAGMLSISITGYLLVAYFNKRAAIRSLKNVTLRAAISILILVSGCILFWVKAAPPPDAFFGGAGWFNLVYDRNEFLHAIGTVWDGYIPVPQFSIQFWNTNLLADGIVKVILSITLIVLFSLLFKDNIALLLLYVGGVILMLVFIYTKYPGYLRHHGHFYILLLICLWLNKVHQKPAGEKNVPYLTIFVRRFLLRTVFCIHFAAAVYAYYMELQYPFSASKMAAGFIRSSLPPSSFIAGYKDVAASAVSMWLNQPFYYPSSHRTGTYILFDKQRKKMETGELVHTMDSLANTQPPPIYLVSNQPINSSPAILSYELIHQFDTAIVKDEIYYLYKIKKKY